jgi:hypothetical protein
LGGGRAGKGNGKEEKKRKDVSHRSWKLFYMIQASAEIHACDMFFDALETMLGQD